VGRDVGDEEGSRLGRPAHRPERLRPRRRGRLDVDHDPGFHLFGTTHDGYRFSSPLHASGDPYDSNNVANYFRNQGELHPFTGNRDMHVGDVLFFSGDDSKNGLDHTAMVSKVDAHGHATEIVKSTGSASVARDWNTFEQKIREQHKTLVEFGRPDFARGR
jgi:hypothetical protein